jgi:hypothetical protein
MSSYLLRAGLLAFLLACGGAAPPPATIASPPPLGVIRYVVGGDSRDDASHVLPWAFREAKGRGATAFFFLGDMELTPQLESHFEQELKLLDPVPFYPALGNHEVKVFGIVGAGQDRAERDYRARFLGTPRTPVTSAIDGKVVYSVDLPGGVHFVALDNVSQTGFGDDQLAWLASDLEKAHADPRVRYVIVGMHKPLAHNGISAHAMDADGLRAVADSEAALALFVKNHVSLIFASHVHRFASFTQASIPSYITGGLGAPLDHSDAASGFHHLLQLDVAEDGIHVTVVRFDGKPSVGEEAPGD